LKNGQREEEEEEEEEEMTIVDAIPAVRLLA